LPSAPDLTLGKDLIFFLKNSLPSVLDLALAEEIFQKKNFTECQSWDTRQRNFKKKIKSLSSAVPGALGKVF